MDRRSGRRAGARTGPAAARAGRLPERTERVARTPARRSADPDDRTASRDHLHGFAGARSCSAAGLPVSSPTSVRRRCGWTRTRCGELLARSGCCADPATIETVVPQTEGWAFGVDLAARVLAETAGAADVLDELDDVLDDVIEAEVLDQLPAACREMIVRTSVSAEVPAGLSRAILGEDVAGPSAWIDEAQGFLDAGRGRLAGRCHPLLRRAARRRLDRDWPSLSRQARRAAARWNIDHGDRSSGLALAADLADWDWAATALVRIAGRTECSARGGGSGHGRDRRSGRARGHRATDRGRRGGRVTASRRPRRPPSARLDQVPEDGRP